MILDWRWSDNDEEILRLGAAHEFTKRALGLSDGVEVYCLGRLWTLDELIDHLGMRKECEDAERDRKEREKREAEKIAAASRARGNCADRC